MFVDWSFVYWLDEFSWVGGLMLLVTRIGVRGKESGNFLTRFESIQRRKKIEKRKSNG